MGRVISNTKRTWVITAAVTLAIIVVWMTCHYISAWLETPVSFGSGPSHFFEIKKDDVDNKPVYVMSRRWGISGGSQEIVISLKPLTDAQRDRTEEIKYQDEDVIFCKKPNDDSIIIYVNRPMPVPSEFSNQIRVIQIPFSQDDKEFGKIREFPENHGFTRVSVYKDN